MIHHVSISESLNEALGEVDTTTADAAVIELAQRYAAVIDAEPEALEKFGPKLLAALDALRLTPKARTVAAKGGNADAPAEERNPADELRARRAARLARTTDLDAATS